MKMNNRIQKIIFLLLEEPNITIKEMMRKLSLTRRQINYAIGLINERLKEKKLPIIERHRDGTFTFSSKIKEALVSYGKQKSDITYSDSDRKTLILLYLIFNTKYVSLNHFTLFLNYSKTTISYDLKEINESVKRHNLKLAYSRLEGFSLVGSEDDIFRLGTSLILNHIKLLSGPIADKLNPNSAVIKSMTILLMNIEDKFQASFSDNYFDALKIILEAIFIRGLNNYNSGSKIDTFISQTKEYKYLRQLRLLKKLDNQHVGWVALEILSSNLYDKSNFIYSPDELQILKYIHQIVEGFEAKTLVKIDDRSRFEKRLLNHLRPACFRVKYNLPSIGTIVNVSQDNHQILMKIITELVHPLGKWLGTSFPRNEIKLLTYYFGYQLIGNYKIQDEISPKYKTAVVCSNGIIMSKILIRELRDLFPEMNFLFTMSAREFEESNEQFDVVFTTLPLKTKFSQYVVSPNMSYSQKISLRYQVLNDLGIEKTDEQVQRILNLISKYAMITDNNHLRQGIKRILVSNKKDTSQKKSNNLPNLLFYIKPEYIQVIDQKIEWHTALQMALQPLLSQKRVSKEYYYELVKQIENPYNYSFLGRYISIPHATTQHGIKDNGISILISKFPIKLPNNKEVRIIAPIAFFHMNKFLNAVNQFAALAIDSENIQKLINSSDSKGAYQIIKNYVEKEDKK